MADNRKMSQQQKQIVWVKLRNRRKLYEHKIDKDKYNAGQEWFRQFTGKELNNVMYALHRASYEEVSELFSSVEYFLWVKKRRNGISRQEKFEIEFLQSRIIGIFSYRWKEKKERNETIKLLIQSMEQQVKNEPYFFTSWLKSFVKPDRKQETNRNEEGDQNEEEKPLMHSLSYGQEFESENLLKRKQE